MQICSVRGWTLEQSVDGVHGAHGSGCLCFPVHVCGSVIPNALLHHCSRSVTWIAARRAAQLRIRSFWVRPGSFTFAAGVILAVLQRAGILPVILASSIVRVTPAFVLLGHTLRVGLMVAGVAHVGPQGRPRLLLWRFNQASATAPRVPAGAACGRG